MNTDDDHMRRLGYPPAEDETVTVNKHAFEAIIAGALSHAVHRADDTSISAAQWGTTPAESKGSKPEPKADEDAPDPAETAMWAKFDALMDTLCHRLDCIEKDLNGEDQQ